MVSEDGGGQYVATLAQHTGSADETLTAELTDILARGAVTSVFQPIVDLASRSVRGYEALARGPQGPLSSPLALFAAARRADLLAALDAECRAAAFRGAGASGLGAPTSIFVNVEPEVLDSAPLSDLLAVADDTPRELPVVIEITERALASRPAELLRAVDRVRCAGWGVALDDVGVEPASLAFMSVLRPDVVKLDMSLVQERPGAHLAEVMHAVNSYAEDSGALVLAEGIETERHLVTALSLGATLGQGWLFGRPTATPSPGAVRTGLVLPRRPDAAATETRSPFDALPDDVVLRRAPKRLLVEVSKQLEREAVRLGETCVVASTFQYREHFTPATETRYRDVVAHVGFACVLGEGMPLEPAPGLRGTALAAEDPLVGEWDIAVLHPHFAAALLARDLGDSGPDLDRRFEYAVTYRREVVTRTMRGLLSRVAPHTPTATCC